MRTLLININKVSLLLVVLSLIGGEEPPDCFGSISSFGGIDFMLKQ